MDKLIQEYLTKEFIEIKESATVLEALNHMLDNHIEVIVVRAPNGRITGTLTEVDLISQFQQIDFEKETVGIIARNLRMLSLSPSDTMDSAAHFVVQFHNIDHIPVEEKGEVIGFIRKIDILRWIFDELKPSKK